MPNSVKNKLPTLFYFMLIFAFIYNFFIPLHPDEAYYWTWSQHLDWSYYDGPPLIAYLIWLSTTLFGTFAWSIKLVGLACAFGTAVIGYRWTHELFGHHAANKFMVLLLLFPFFQASTVIATYDAPLVFFWLLTLYTVWNALESQRSVAWLWAGLAAGALILSKAPGVLLLVVLAGYIVFSKHRRCLLTLKPYIAVACVIIALIPMIIWNAEHNWISFSFQLQRGIADSKVFSWDLCSTFLGGQWLATNPILLFLFIATLIFYRHELKKEPISYLLWPFLLTWLFFAYQACFHESEVNWPAATYASAIIMIAGYLAQNKTKWLYKTYIVISVLFIIIAKIPFLINVYPQQGFLLAKFVGYEPLVKQASSYLDSETPIVSDTYQTASELMFYLPTHPQVYLIAPLRATEYDIWSASLKEAIIQGGVPRVTYVGNAENLAGLNNYFKHCEPITTLNYSSKIVSRSWIVATCSA